MADNNDFSNDLLSQQDYVETENRSLGQNLVNSFWEVLFGIVLIIATAILIFWNEGRAVRDSQSAHEFTQFKEADSHSIHPELEGKLIYLSGSVQASSELRDPITGITTHALVLKRVVEYRQWKESVTSTTHKQVGGSSVTEKTYHYELVWNPATINSSHFKHPQGHNNPSGRISIPSDTFANPGILDAYTIPPSFLQDLANCEDIRMVDAIHQLHKEKGVTCATIQDFNLPADAPNLIGAIKTNQDYYFGDDPNYPQAGDIRLHYTELPTPLDISIIAQQSGSTLTDYMTHSGQARHLIIQGKQPPQIMIATFKEENFLYRWLFRFLSFFLMFCGIKCLLAPLEALAGIIPLFSSMVGAFDSAVAGATGLGLTVMLTAAAWFTARPVVSLCTISIGVIGIGWFFYHRSQNPKR